MKKRYPLTMMCAACIPWTENLEFDEKAFRRQVKSFVDNDIKSIYIFGTAGEGYAINTKMYAEILSVFMDECKKGKDVMPMTGIIGTSIMEMYDRIDIARELGCRDIQISFPCWGTLNKDEILAFFKLVCGKYQDCRFIHYNNGPRSKTYCSIDDYIVLAKEVRNLVAVKYSTSNISLIHNLVTADCPITFYIVDSSYTFASMKGECGFLNSFASIDMDKAWKYFYAGQNKDYNKLLELDTYYRDVSKCFGSISREVMDSAIDKSIERFADNEFRNTLYPPYVGITEQEFLYIKERLDKVLEKHKEL